MITDSMHTTHCVLSRRVKWQFSLFVLLMISGCILLSLVSTTFMKSLFTVGLQYHPNKGTVFTYFDMLSKPFCYLSYAASVHGP